MNNDKQVKKMTVNLGRLAPRLGSWSELRTLNAKSSDGTFHLAAFMNSDSLLVVNLKLWGLSGSRNVEKKGFEMKENGWESYNVFA